MKPNVLITLFVALGAICSFARVVEDSKSRFVLDDDVIESSVHECLDAKDRGGVFLPENAAYLDGNAVPFRYYHIALPSNVKPSVSVRRAHGRRIFDPCHGAGHFPGLYV